MAVITGNSSANLLNGTSNADKISGLGGNDTLSGLGGNDTLLGGNGNDSLLGGTGADSLVGGPGADTLNGGGGNDIYVIDASDTLVDSSGIDTVRANFTYTLSPGFENLVLLGGAAINGTGNAGANAITGNGAANNLIGGGGNDTLNGGLGADVLAGGDGADVLIHGAGDTSVRGGAGADTLRVDGSGVTLNLTAIANAVHSDIEVISLTGTGNNILRLAGSDVVAFSTSTNTLRVSGNAGDRVLALDGNWTFVQNVAIGPQTYAVYTRGLGTLQVDVDIDRDAIAQSSIDLATLDGTNGFRLEGVALNDWSGTSVSGAGDVNGDGLDDLIVGAQFADPSGSYSGASYVVFGKAGGFASSINLSTLNGTNGFRLEGVAAGDELGSSVSGAGDVNGDGFDDVIVGARGADPNGTSSGASYVVFGKAGGFAASIDLSTLNGTNGFRLEGVAAYDASGGFSVSGAGDVNGDGFDDIIVGVRLADPNGDRSGASYVVFGKAGGFAASIDLSTLNGTNGFRLEGVAAGDLSGYSVSAAGDVNGDGFDDLIVGADNASPNGIESGASYVVFGKAGGFAASIDLSSLNGTNGFRLAGVTAGDYSGNSVSAAGDVNGDGFGDLIVGAWGADPSGDYSGTSYVVFGKAGGFAASIDLSTLNGTSGFRLEGVSQYDEAATVSAAGDVNGDGFDDLIVGARFAAPNGIESGASYVVFGKASGFASSIDPSTLNGTNGFRLAGVTVDEEAGVVSAAGDVNGDGFDDLIVGARFADPNGDRSGASYVVYGGNFTGAVTFLGAGGADAMSGSAAAERFVSGQGNDTLTGSGGADVFNAGAGNDVIRVASTTFRQVDGGGGVDTLAILGAGHTLDLTVIANNKIGGIERIDLTGGGNNTLEIGKGDLLDLSDSTNQLTVSGNAGDKVDLVGTWTDGGAGATYHTYTLGAATILIDNDIFVI